MKKVEKSIFVLWILMAFMTTVVILPGPVNTGNLEPPPEGVGGSGNPISTMKTLDQTPHMWSQVLPGSERFDLVIGDAAVLDKETGLVWEQSPDITENSWCDACSYCYQKEVGGRKGWRLPTIEELASLIDTTQVRPALPNGHPFSNVRPSSYWSSTTYAYDTNFAWSVHFYNGRVTFDPKKYSYYVWCVRGGHRCDAY